MTTRIHVTDLCHTFRDGLESLRGISLTIPQGNTVAIVGHNGAGKTTLIKHINGLLMPTSGTVTLNGCNTINVKPSEIVRLVSFVFQNPDDQIFSRTIEQEAGYGLKHVGITGVTAKIRVHMALEATGLAGQEQVNPQDLSLAERKLLTIASALVMDSDVIIFDEPTMGQDQNGMARITAILGMLKQRGKTVVTVSHNMDFCLEHFSRVIIMRQGKIFLDGPTGEVFSRHDLLQHGHIIPPQLSRLARKINLPAGIRTEQEFFSLLQMNRFQTTTYNTRKETI